MIRFSGRSDRGRLLITFGLSEANIQQMKNGKPIHVHCDDMGFVGEIMIFTGKDEDAMAKMLIDGGIEFGEIKDLSKQPRQ